MNHGFEKCTTETLEIIEGNLARTLQQASAVDASEIGKAVGDVFEGVHANVVAELAFRRHRVPAVPA